MDISLTCRSSTAAFPDRGHIREVATVERPSKNMCALETGVVQSGVGARGRAFRRATIGHILARPRQRPPGRCAAAGRRSGRAGRLVPPRGPREAPRAPLRCSLSCLRTSRSSFHHLRPPQDAGLHSSKVRCT